VTAGRVGSVALNPLRVALGVEFLWAFLDKTFGLGYATPSAKAWIHGGSPTKGSCPGSGPAPCAVRISAGGHGDDGGGGDTLRGPRRPRRPSKGTGPVHLCQCGPRIRVAPTVRAAGPITCGICGSDFSPA
jgi:hypothetical protein